MPALVNRRFGESGSRLEEPTIVCLFSLKKSRNVRRISSAFMVATSNIIVSLGRASAPDAGGELLAAPGNHP